MSDLAIAMTGLLGGIPIIMLSLWFFVDHDGADQSDQDPRIHWDR